MQNDLRITFIGGGNMAAALLGGLADKLTAGANIHVVDINADALARLQQQFGVTIAPQIDAAVAASDVIVLAVKPQQMRDVAAQLRPHVGQQLVLSIAAGIRGADLSRWLGGHSAIVRTMPNTPALIGQGITGMAALPGVSPSQREAADAIMRAVGVTVWLDDESLIDPVTAISGSGPAYVFYFIEAMQQAALELGLSSEQARALSLQTFLGASQLALQRSETPDVLRTQVTSKGGTTERALNRMQELGVKPAIMQAIHAAAERSRELGDLLGKD